MWPIDHARQTINCAGCGESTGTHMDSVEMYARPLGEDRDVVRIEVQASGRMMVSPAPERGRRHSIILWMTCEQCSHVTALEFKQHKGETQFSYR